MKKIIIPVIVLMVIIIIATAGYFLFSQNKSCFSDNDCKLIYNGCSCEAVHKNDRTTTLPDNGIVCEVNDCENRNVSAICSNNQCVRSDSVNN